MASLAFCSGLCLSFQGVLGLLHRHTLGGHRRLMLLLDDRVLLG